MMETRIEGPLGDRISRRPKPSTSSGLTLRRTDHQRGRNPRSGVLRKAWVNHTGADSDDYLSVGSRCRPLHCRGFCGRASAPGCRKIGLVGLVECDLHDLRRTDARGPVHTVVQVKPAQVRPGCAGPRSTLGIWLDATTDALRAAAGLLLDPPDDTFGMEDAREPSTPPLTWSGRRDSNPRPQRPERCALTKLRHFPVGPS